MSQADRPVTTSSLSDNDPESVKMQRLLKQKELAEQKRRKQLELKGSILPTTGAASIPPGIRPNTARSPSFAEPASPRSPSFAEPASPKSPTSATSNASSFDTEVKPYIPDDVLLIKSSNPKPNHSLKEKQSGVTNPTDKTPHDQTVKADGNEPRSGTYNQVSGNDATDSEDSLQQVAGTSIAPSTQNTTNMQSSRPPEALAPQELSRDQNPKNESKDPEVSTGTAETSNRNQSAPNEPTEDSDDQDETADIKKNFLKKGSESTEEINERKALNGLTHREFIHKNAEVGQKMLCKIVRSKEGVGKQWYPYYEVFFEHPTMGDIFLMSARKRKKSASANYVISSTKLRDNKQKEDVVGKIRANFLGTSFTIYDSGMNPFKEKDSTSRSTSIRREYASVIFETNVLGLKGPRKMTALIPAIQKDGNPVVFKPELEKDTILERYRVGQAKDLVVLHNKPPQWNEDTRSYVLNFSGRVTVASVKNFQIIHENDPDYIVMQFGRVNESTFSMDFQYPLNALQAFSIALTSFDAKLACE